MYRKELDLLKLYFFVFFSIITVQKTIAGLSNGPLNVVLLYPKVRTFELTENYAPTLAYGLSG